MFTLFQSILRIMKTLYDRFFEDHCPSRAASLSYTSLLSLIPLAMVVFYILSWVPLFNKIGPEVQQFILSNFVADSANVISHYLDNFIQNSHHLSTTSIISLGVISVLLIYNMVGAFNEIWHIRIEKGTVISFFIYLLTLVLAPLFFAFLLVTASYLISLPFFSTPFTDLLIKRPLLSALPYLSEVFIFFLFNYVLPSTRVRLPPALVAGLITTLLFELAKHGFVLYLRYFPTYRLIYGALATIPIFLVWMYVTWLIILFGGLCCHLMCTELTKNTQETAQ